MKQPWSEVEKELLQAVFWAHNFDEVMASSDLTESGLKDSLADVMIVEILEDSADSGDVLDKISKQDLRTWDAIRTFYAAL